MRIGFLGGGFMGGRHARAFAQIDGVEAAIILSTSPDKGAGAAGPRHRGDLRRSPIIDVALPETANVTLSRKEGSSAKRPSECSRVRNEGRFASGSSLRSD
jgi:hypothetical protein